jgi:60 kDa SS-A/Ro ribonucleoprotein
MSNKNVFQQGRGVLTPAADARNEAGGKAYSFSSRQCLAQVAATNCFNGTFYASASDTLKLAKEAALALNSDPEFIAKCAIYSRSKGYMKDMPAFLTAMLAGMDSKLFRQVFPLVIDNGKMLRNFCQIARSGAVGKKINLASQGIRKAISGWFEAATPAQILSASIGNEFPIRDLLRAAHVFPSSIEKATLLAYLKGTKLDPETRSYRTMKFKNGKDNKDGMVLAYEHSYDNLPGLIKQYEEYKTSKTGTPPKVDFRLLDSLGLDTAAWTEIARNAPWAMTRMNLNTFARHGVFQGAHGKEMVELIANRLRNPQEIARARAFPYQLMMAWTATESNADIPASIRDALQDAMEIACDNVPEIPGQVYICVDHSGSMSGPVTGNRPGATSKVTCLDVAALFAAALLRKNKTAIVLPFAGQLTTSAVGKFNARDAISTNAAKLKALGGGSTNCSAPLAWLNANNRNGDLIVFISDYESWVDSGSHYVRGSGTAMLTEWNKFAVRNKTAKLVCMDLTPRNTGQVTEHSNILQVGGFSDAVFNVISTFMESGHDKNHWVSEIEKISLKDQPTQEPVVEVAETEE